MAVNKSAGRVLPNSIEAEQSVLGCVLLNQDAAMNIFMYLKEDDFYSQTHKTIYGQMLKIYQRQIPVDFVTLTNQLEKTGLLNEVGSITYITQLTNVVPSASNYMHYAGLVKRDSILRQLIDAAGKIMESAYESTDESVLQEAEKLIFDIGNKEQYSKLEPLKGSLNDVLERLQIIAKDKNALKGVRTDFYALDKITNGFQKGDLVLIAARPSVGKTSFAMNIVTNVATKFNGKVAVFSLEMPKEQLAQRSLCSVAKVSMSKAMSGELTSKDWTALWAANEKLSNAEIYVDDSSLNVPSTILSKCRKLKREHGLDLVVIDYLQLMSSDNSKSKDNRQTEVAAISRALKICAKELQVPVIVLSQLSRAIETRTGHKPVLSDLRESGAIEQDADIVMFLHNPEKYLDDADAKSNNPAIDLIIAKHRNGALDEIQLKFISEYTTFVSLTKDSNAGSLEELEPPMPSNKNLPDITPLAQNTDLTDIFN